MRRLLGPVLFASVLLLAAGWSRPAAAKGDWHMNATVIEACSCPMFCQCYFNTEPAGHGEGGHGSHGGGSDHYCKFNMAYKINKGNYEGTKLDGAKFWIAGDLGSEFHDGEMDWAVVTFDKSMTKEQREGVGVILGSLFPVKWKSLTTAEGTIDTWEFNKNIAKAKLDGGKSGELVLIHQAESAMAAEPTVIHNLRYWGAPRNDGFVLMKNEVEAYRVGDQAFEFKGTNGFMITLDIASKDMKTEE